MYLLKTACTDLTLLGFLCGWQMSLAFFVSFNPFQVLSAMAHYALGQGLSLQCFS